MQNKSYICILNSNVVVMTLKEAVKILKSEEFYKYLLGIGIPVSGDSIRISSKDIENYKFEE